jgi:hypothetical protein
MSLIVDLLGGKKKGGKKEKKLKLPEGMMLADEMLAKYNQNPKLGEAVISSAQMDQRTTINPVTLEGQAEIIYNIWLYRVAKWHFNVVKAEEFIIVTPTAPPAFAPLLAQKERLEGQIKASLASVAQLIADYELLKHDERRYREILDFFKEGEKDEHVLRALFVDRVDAYTGEGYSMVTMAKRWPTIISDFIRMETALEDVDKIKEELKVSKAEAVVLKTKNSLYKEWKRLFFPDVKARYVRIKNLLDARERSIDQYREWIKPYMARHKMIKEDYERRPSADLDDCLHFMNSPEGYIYAKLWVIKPFRPEEMGKPMILQGQGHEIDPYDDWVKEKSEILEKMYGVRIYEDEKDQKKRELKEGKWPYNILVRKFIEKQVMPGVTAPKKANWLATHPGGVMDPRFIYYIFIDLDYEVNYKKGSTGPMVVEDQYFHFHPWLLSQNALLLFLLEMEAKKLQFDQEIDRMIGTSKIERTIEESLKDEFEKQEKAIKRFESFFSLGKKMGSAGGGIGKKVAENLEPMSKYFFRPGPYENTVNERIAKMFGDYFGPQVAEMVDLIKESCYRLSGVGL